MKKCEILAPVGNFEMLQAAVRLGADAVYLGAKDFNARRNAENFGEFDLQKAVEYCHAFNVKVYLTLNISIKENEVGIAADLAVFAQKCGVDALIVTDLGLCGILNTVCPDMPLHASTQMTVHSLSALPALQKLGIKRVVLSREMTAEKIAEFVKKADECGIETEIFVHGALCMSMSGQCLLSAALGGRSGNRGLCAGPCRLPFKRLPKTTSGYTPRPSNEYALSLKDLSLADKINELAEMGVASLKIEGRMKRPEYVAAAVSTIKKCRDGEDFLKDYERLQAVFSRSGFTSGYFDGKLGEDMFGVRTKEDVTAAGATFSSLHELYRADKPRVKINAAVRIKSEEPIRLTLSADGFTGEAELPAPSAAQNREVTEDDVLRAISKLGGTPYILENAEIELDAGLFVPVSLLNNLRTQAVKSLTEQRTKTEDREVFSLPDAPESIKQDGEKIICRFEENAQIPRDLNGIYGVMVPLENEPPVLPENLLKIAELPRAIKSEKAISERLQIFKSRGFTHAAIGNIAEIELVKAAGLKIFSFFAMNTYNSYDALFLEQSGAEFITASPELTFKEAHEIKTHLPLGIFAYGRLPLMLTANCPVNNGDCASCDKKRRLTDRMGVEFPVRCRMGFAELLNSKPIFLADKVGELKGFSFLTLYFTDESPDTAKKVIDAYAFGNTYTPADYTRGLYFRGVE
ncbi:MAG: U32 family peptidase [Clostridiales bacterium]|nr:U32 family peptidase [Candidatus Equinaster intestinalis]